MLKKSVIKKINFDDYIGETTIKHNLKWSYILDDPYGILII